MLSEWKKSEEEECGGEGESMENKYEVEVWEEEDIMEEENVFEEEMDQI